MELEEPILQTQDCTAKPPSSRQYSTGTKPEIKCRVRELEKVKFGKRTRLALYGNRSPIIRQEGAAARLVSCCTNPRKQ